MALTSYAPVVVGKFVELVVPATCRPVGPFATAAFDAVPAAFGADAEPDKRVEDRDVSDKPLFIRDLPLLSPKNIASIDALYRKRLQSLQAVDEAIRNGKDYQAEFRLVRADGSVGWVCARGAVQVDDHGKPKRLTGISLDITAGKEAEILARQQRDELEELRQQKTALLEREVAERTRLEREVIESCAREQRRIAYEQVVGIALSAKLLEEQLRPRHPEEAKKASAIVKLANEAARQTRLTARTLEGADGVGDLKTALEALAINMSQDCRVKSMVKANAASLPISAPVAAQLYRIAQEAVHNAVEHGAAHEVLIQLTLGNRDMVLTVQDDGQGFEAKINGHGMGLRIMRYRAQCIGGSCHVRTAHNKGTVVHCRVPLEAEPSIISMIS